MTIEAAVKNALRGVLASSELRSPRGIGQIARHNQEALAGIQLDPSLDNLRKPLADHDALLDEKQKALINTTDRAENENLEKEIASLKEKSKGLYLETYLKFISELLPVIYENGSFHPEITNYYQAAMQELSPPAVLHAILSNLMTNHAIKDSSAITQIMNEFSQKIDRVDEAYQGLVSFFDKLQQLIDNLTSTDDLSPYTALINQFPKEAYSNINLTSLSPIQQLKLKLRTTQYNTLKQFRKMRDQHLEHLYENLANNKSELMQMTQQYETLLAWQSLVTYDKPTSSERQRIDRPVTPSQESDAATSDTHSMRSETTQDSLHQTVTPADQELDSDSQALLDKTTGFLDTLATQVKSNLTESEVFRYSMLLENFFNAYFNTHSLEAFALVTRDPETLRTRYKEIRTAVLESFQGLVQSSAHSSPENRIELDKRTQSLERFFKENRAAQQFIPKESARTTPVETVAPAAASAEPPITPADSAMPATASAETPNAPADPAIPATAPAETAQKLEASVKEQASSSPQAKRPWWKIGSRAATVLGVLGMIAGVALMATGVGAIIGAPLLAASTVIAIGGGIGELAWNNNDANKPIPGDQDPTSTATMSRVHDNKGSVASTRLIGEALSAVPTTTDTSRRVIASALLGPERLLLPDAPENAPTKLSEQQPFGTIGNLTDPAEPNKPLLVIPGNRR